jgi:FMN-dependent NADH-azoreductase
MRTKEASMPTNSRDLTHRIVDRFERAQVTTRDLATPLPQIAEDWIGANFTPAADRTAAQAETLRLSDTLIEEVKAADVLVIGLPIYNFGVPAALKAWIDLVARAGVTFQYSPTGPKGLLAGKRAIVAVASGGTEMGSDIDFATGYIRHVLGFIGITDVVFVAADRLSRDADATLAEAHLAVQTLKIAA